MRLAYFLSFCSLLGSTSSANQSTDCGSFNGAKCEGLHDKVIWHFGPEVWAAFMKGAEPSSCKVKFEKRALVWKCEWNHPDAVAYPLLTGPCLDLKEDSEVTAQLDASFDLKAPTNREEQLDERREVILDYPCFTIKTELSAGNQDNVIRQHIVGFHDASRRHNIQLAPAELKDGSLKCVSLQAWASNRLKHSKLSGTMTFFGGQIMLKRQPFRVPSNLSLDELRAVYANAMSHTVSREDKLVHSGTVSADSGGYETGSVLQSGVIEEFAIPQEFVVDFVVSYENKCSGSPLAWGVMASSESFSMFEQGQKSQAVVTGTGPLALVDLAGVGYSKQAILKKYCSLRIDGVELLPAAPTLEQFDRDLEKLSASVEIQRAVVENDADTFVKSHGEFIRIRNKWSKGLELIRKVKDDAVARFELLQKISERIFSIVE